MLSDNSDPPRQYTSNLSGLSSVPVQLLAILINVDGTDELSPPSKQENFIFCPKSHLVPSRSSNGRSDLKASQRALRASEEKFGYILAECVNRDLHLRVARVCPPHDMVYIES